MKRNLVTNIMLTIGGLVAIVGTVFAMSDNFINKATFQQFKEHIIYRLDRIDKKLDVLLVNKEEK